MLVLFYAGTRLPPYHGDVAISWGHWAFRVCEASQAIFAQPWHVLQIKRQKFREPYRLPWHVPVEPQRILHWPEICSTPIGLRCWRVRPPAMDIVLAHLFVSSPHKMFIWTICTSVLRTWWQTRTLWRWRGLPYGPEGWGCGRASRDGATPVSFQLIISLVLCF